MCCLLLSNWSCPYFVNVFGPLCFSTAVRSMHHEFMCLDTRRSQYLVADNVKKIWCKTRSFFWKPLKKKIQKIQCYAKPMRLKINAMDCSYNLNLISLVPLAAMLWRLAQLLRWAALNNESKLLETPKRPVDNAKLFWKDVVKVKDWEFHCVW